MSFLALARLANVYYYFGVVMFSVSAVRADSSLDAAMDAVAPGIRKWATLCLLKPKSGPDAPMEFDWIDYRDTGHRTDFWPASTVKLFTAIAACELLHAKQLPLDTTTTFAHESGGNWHTDCARTVREMISEVFRRSSNEDYTLLLRLCGIDELNQSFLTPERGFPATALMRGYTADAPWRYGQKERQRITLQATPTLAPVVREHQWSGRDYGAERGITVLFSENGNLTSTRVLCDCLRRVLFHPDLPREERFRISDEQAHFLKHGGPDGFHGLESHLGPQGPTVWQKAWAEVFPRAKHYQKLGLISNYALDLCCIDDRAQGGPCFLLATALNAGHATRPREGEQLASDLTRAIALWVQKRH